MKNFRTLVFCLTIELILVGNYKVTCQFLKPPKNILSPNAASLGQFGDIPISLFTGLPSIDIPIHAVTEGNISVPISLNYHASGVRPDQHPGWVGLNWNLSCGGSITRKVNDLMDEADIPVLGSQDGTGIRSGYYFTHNVTNPSDWDTKNYIRSLYPEKYLKDTEPDEFSFNFLNYSGKFYLDHLGNWIVKTDADIKVTFDGTFIDSAFDPPFNTLYWDYSKSYPKSFNGFTLTDANGIQFIFGGTTEAIEYTIPFYDQSVSFWTANTWYLSKIKMPDGREVNFKYGHDKKLNELGKTVRNEFVNTMFISLYYRKLTTVGGTFVSNCKDDPFLISPYGKYSGELISPVYLESIESSTQKILFIRSESVELRVEKKIYDEYRNEWLRNQAGFQLYPFLNGTRGYDDYPKILDNLKWRKLDNIQVFRLGDVKPTKQYDFTYNNNASERLMLQKMVQHGQNESVPSYEFFYNTSISLPSYLADHSDHWGFYNGEKAYVYTKDKANLLSYYSFREPDSKSMQAGILTKIVYPTGGATLFEYESHTYSREVDVIRNNPLINHSTNLTTGGLRVWKTADYSSSDLKNPVEKEYLYVSNYSNAVDASTLLSSGILGGRAKYYWDDYKGYVNDDPSHLYTQEVFSTSSVLPASNNSHGSHVGYSEVVEKRKDNSYTVYKFSNFDTGNMDEVIPLGSILQPTRTIYDPYIDKSFERGLLTLQEIRDSQNRPQSKKILTYSALSDSHVRTIKATSLLVCENAYGISEGYALKYYTYKYKKNLETNYLYNPINSSDWISEKSTYNYYDNGQLSEQLQQGNGKDVSIRIKYPSNIYRDSSPIPATEPAIALSKMKELHMTGVVVEKQIWERPVGQASWKLTNGDLTIFKEFPANKVFPKAEYKYRTKSPVLEFIDTGINASGALEWDTYNPLINDLNGYEAVTYYDEYDINNGNLLQFHQEKGFTVACLWGYHGSFPVAKIVNATYGLVLNSLGSSLINEINATPPQDEILRQKLSPLYDQLLYKNSQTTIYTYNPVFGMTSSTDSNGIITYYEYDTLGRLSLLRDANNNILKKYDYNYQLK